MKRTLTAGGIVKMKAGSARREIHDAGAQGLHLVIQTSGHKSFALRFRRPGGARAKLTLGPFNPDEPVGEPVIGGALTLAQARVLAAGLNMKRVDGTDLVAVQRVERQRRRVTVSLSSANTFGAAALDFIANHKVRKTGERPRRWKETESLLATLRWDERPISSIDADDIHDAIQRASTGRRMADALGTMFKYLHQHRRIKINPALGLLRPPPPPSRERVLSDAELRELWHACGPLGQPWGPLVKVLILTGQRLNEIARLQDSELTDDMISLPANRTKNGLPHDVPLSATVRKILGTVRRMPNCKYVFSTNGTSPVSGFSKLKVKIDGLLSINEPWRIHDLRRTASTGMNGLGVAPWIVEACLNHISGAKSGVAGVYNRALYVIEKRDALERWALRVQEITR